MSTYARPRPAESPEAGLLRPDEIEGVLKPLEEANPLPPRIYADPDVFAAEQERILRREWLPAGFLDQVRKPGDYYTTDILGEPLLVVCSPDGEVRTYYNVCRHRAMRVAEKAGNQQYFECPYHGWTYDGHGQLVQALHMEQNKAFCMKDISLLEVRTEVWQSFVMINFDPDAEPLAPRLKGLSAFLEPWDLPSMRIVIDKRFECPWNWKVMFENANEGYHVMALHRNSAQEALPTEALSVESLNGYYSIFHMPYAEGLDESKDWLARQDRAQYTPPPIPGLPETGYAQVEFIAVFPCLGFSVQHDSMTAFPVIPHKLDRNTFWWGHHLPPDSVSDHPGFGNYIEAQDAMIEKIQSEDTDASIGVQKGWASTGAAPTYLSHLEETTWQFHRWYAERMKQ